MIATSPRRLRILLLEDEPLTRLCIEGAARDRGYEVISAASGCGVLHLLKTRPADILITDISMPKVNGLKVLELARGRRSAYPRIPIIVQSSRWDLKDQAIALGADAFLGKPVDCDDLLKVTELLTDRGISAGSLALLLAPFLDLP